DERKDLASGFGPPAGVYGFNDHIVTGTRLGLDGRVYVSVGDKGVPKAVGADGSTITLEGGGVIRMKLDGTQLEVVTSGTRNHLDVAMDSLDNIFTYDNTDDGLGWWTRFTHHVPTGYYGYPYDYHPHPERHLPRISEHGGGSPVGAACYREAAWPATYVDSPFFCEWGKSKVQRFKLTRDGASFKAEIEDFLVPDGSPEPFRPLDLCFSPDGRHMYLADWNFNGWVNPAVKGRLFRITYVGDEPAVKTEPPRAPKNASTAELLASLGHPSHAERLRAELAIAGRGAEAVRAATTLLASPASSPRAKVHAIWAAQLHASKVTPDAAAAAGERVRPVDAWIAALADADATVRAQAARALGTERAKEKEAIDALGKVVRGDRDATVRMQAAIALGRIGDAQPDAQWTSTDSGQAGAIVPRLDDKHLAPQKAGDARVAAPLWEALVEPDQYARHVVVQALRTINNWQDAPTYLARPDTRPGALLALTGVYDEEAVRALRDFALKGTPDGGRAAAVAALTEVHRRAAPYEKGWWGTQPARGKPVRAKNQDWSGTSTVLGTLRDVLDNPGPLAAKLAVVQAWRTIPDPAALPQLRKLAAQRDGGELASEAVKSLAAMKDRESVGLLASIAGDAQAPETLRREALRGITAIGSPEAVKQLQEIVASGASTPVIVQAALEALGTLKIADSAPAVAARLADMTPAVRISAATSLAQIIGEKAAVR
ncbi:MAG TPA: HEAT repeat domain-containing protein, partial [Pirellulaceae bacterium]|nr:HEAT repeat domain-containing protein [Pirellulaceae bacterium]